MNRGRGASKATSSTLCQKCLKRGHYSYECKSPAQERPYTSRPSRTQQLRNPRLVPKLTNTAPAESLPKKSTTDQLLEKDMTARRRKRSLDDMPDLPRSRKRSRSLSSASISSSPSSVSVHSRHPSTIHPSRSPDTQNPPLPPGGGSGLMNGSGMTDQRSKRPSSVTSSEEAHTSHSARPAKENDRNTRIRRRSNSPGERGRRRSRSASSTQKRERSRLADSVDLGPHSTPRNTKNKTEENLPDGTGDRDMSDVIVGSRRPRHGTPDYARQRSLSPYSKRIALTRNTNTL